MDVEASFHTVIIGGGIAGVSLAYYLAELEGNGNGILVLEADELASGATGGSLGGVRQQFSTPQAVEFGIRGLDFWRSFEDRFDYPCPFHQEGYLLMTSVPETYAMLEAAAEVQRQAGATEVSMLTADDIADTVPWIGTDGLVGGCWTPNDGRVNPTDGVYGLARAARRLGVKFQLHSPVRSISQVGNGWRPGGDGADGDPAGRRRGRSQDADAAQALRPRRAYHADEDPLGLHDPRADRRDLPDDDRHGDRFLCRAGAGRRGHHGDELECAGLVRGRRHADGVRRVAEVRAPIFTEVGIHSTTTAYADATGGDGQPFIGEVEPGLWVLAGSTPTAR
ncbi:NAD(P)/FAD-dependent oxidoreductase [Aeromicrobium sp. UC242_57]|uniref:NAD(P)/FAD-dependent oxidoreductase n=1 Tax=Aeromicrobium sp. UC242_57 TaxID=3374624 RepID=UPI00378788B2